jgi:hypothetical protein
MDEDIAATWRGVSIEEAVERCAEDLVESGLATNDRGYSPAELEATDERLGRPMPDELRTFYSRVTPVSETLYGDYGLISFQPAQDRDLTWLDDPEKREKYLWLAPPEYCWIEGWAQARFLLIGYTPFGDLLLWCDGLRNHPAGTIVVTDHGDDGNVVILGDSLGEWLARYHAFGFEEHAIKLGGLEPFHEDVAIAFLTDHLRLNPKSVWAKQQLDALRNG